VRDQNAYDDCINRHASKSLVSWIVRDQIFS